MSAGEQRSPWTTPRRALVIGDVMLDVFTEGEASRLSPEAPVPVVLRTRRRIAAGGAGNAAANLAALGDSVSIVGVIGSDPDALEVTDVLEGAGVVTGGLVPVPGPTTSKQRVVAGGQQLVRLDVETRRPLAADQVEACLEECRQRINACDVVLISDYGKGVCTPELCHEVIRMARVLGLPVVVDPKGVHYEKYRGATVVTPNLAELRAAVSASASASAFESAFELAFESASNESVDQMAGELLRRIDASVLVTRSAEGMSLYRAGAAPLHLPTQAREVYDVTGAGDTVASVVAAMLARTLDLDRASRLANSCAGVVVGRPGTSPITRDEVVRLWKIPVTTS